jgi:hypothetical protein
VVKKMSRQIDISGEIADGITVLNLKEHRDYLAKELEGYENGQWLHPDDVVMSKQTVAAIGAVLEYFGH